MSIPWFITVENI